MIELKTALLMLALGFPTAKPDSGTMALKTGQKFEQQLNTTLGIQWVGMPLRQGLARLSHRQRVCIMLDRRVDPSQKLKVSLSQVTLTQGLDHIARLVQADSCNVGPVVYLAPPHIARQLPTLAAMKRQEARELSGDLKKRLFRRRSWQWNDLTTPRALLAELADELQIPMEDIDTVPHDLWPAAELPPTSWVNRLSIVTAGFDRSFDIDRADTSIRIIPWPKSIELTRTYRSRPRSKRWIETLRKNLPYVRFDFQKLPWVATGSWEDHRKISRILAGAPIKSKPARVASDPLNGANNVYDISVEASVHELLKTVTRQMELNLNIDPRTADKLQEQVRVEVKQASAQELLHAILDPVNLSFQINDRRLDVLSRDQDQSNSAPLNSVP